MILYEKMLHKTLCNNCPRLLVHSGNVTMGGAMLSDDVINAGYVLTCCAVPTEDCTISTIPEDELLELQLNG